jgi:hypothetical protein
LPIPQGDSVRRILAEELMRARDQSMVTADILKGIQEKVAEATQDRREQLRNGLRRAAGLLPLK